jgi:hypothetical protein
MLFISCFVNNCVGTNITSSSIQKNVSKRSENCMSLTFPARTKTSTTTTLANGYPGVKHFRALTRQISFVRGKKIRKLPIPPSTMYLNNVSQCRVKFKFTLEKYTQIYPMKNIFVPSHSNSHGRKNVKFHKRNNVFPPKTKYK